MKKFIVILAGVIAGAAMIASRQIQIRTQAKSLENDAALRQKQLQLDGLAAENQRLSELIAQTKTDHAPVEDRTNEFAPLRAKIEALRKQTNQMATPPAENLGAKGARFFAQGDFDL